ncbi:dienelactone hydrolase [Subtercola sp. Z020]|uniref:dienelactone hydrolase family protein n=1 Tax=Subtercola sp. Z020 TaxID=2080582 RepID=UPI000CE90C57|nr:dienelactone hydrolase family protein [Subtercola sp. Z020]PPF79744.1 dienelactone hydrolase [Subtercola sp. Z020]
MSQFIDIPSPGWPLTFGVPGNATVVLVHDRFGRLPYLESYATAIASRGFFVVLPDLFNGLATIDEPSADELAGGMDPGFAQATLDDAIELGRNHGFEKEPAESIRSANSRVGVIGFELGGRLALQMAQAGIADAVVSYAGGLGENESGIVPCPVLLHYSDSGEWGTGWEADAFVSRLKEMGTPVTRHTYLGTNDIFANATLVERLNKNAAALAFARSTNFLLEQLAE